MDNEPEHSCCRFRYALLSSVFILSTTHKPMTLGDSQLQDTAVSGMNSGKGFLPSRCSVGMTALRSGVEVATPGQRNSVALGQEIHFLHWDGTGKGSFALLRMTSRQRRRPCRQLERSRMNQLSFVLKELRIAEDNISLPKLQFGLPLSARSSTESG